MRPYQRKVVGMGMPPLAGVDDIGRVDDAVAVIVITCPVVHKSLCGSQCGSLSHHVGFVVHINGLVARESNGANNFKLWGEYPVTLVGKILVGRSLTGFHFSKRGRPADSTAAGSVSETALSAKATRMTGILGEPLWICISPMRL